MTDIDERKALDRVSAAYRRLIHGRPRPAEAAPVEPGQAQLPPGQQAAQRPSGPQSPPAA